MSHPTDTALRQVSARVTEVHAYSAAYHRLTLHAPEIARHATPGQFVQLRVAIPGTHDPLLPRPISLYRVSPTTGEVSVIFKVLGRGTALLAERAVGDVLQVLGPIGNGFAIPASVTSLALIGGGVGMPPLFCLAESLRQQRPDLKITFFYGGRSADDLLELPAWEALGVTVYAATDDGSFGQQGVVTCLLQARLAQERYDFLAACGPRPMLKAVQQLGLSEGIPGQLSLEERMACGVGACLGCVCGTVAGNRRVCVDGPVFSLDEVKFDG